VTNRPRVVIAGLGDTGVLMATRLSASYDVTGISTKPALVSGQELGARLSNLQSWRSSYFIDLKKFKKLDRVSLLHGAVTSVDFAQKSVTVELVNGEKETMGYDILIIATGATNGFWRNGKVQSLTDLESELLARSLVLKTHSHINIIGGGATGVSVADNLARAGKRVDLYISGDAPLAGFHPRAQKWAARVLAKDGVVLHSGYRAVVPENFGETQLSSTTVEWTSGQDPVESDVTLWSIGRVTPHSDFLPAGVLDPQGFVRVNDRLQVAGQDCVFAVGDVAASDPLRSSARNWGWKIVVANVPRALRGRKLKKFKAPSYHWGSVFGLQQNGLVVIQPNGRRFRFPAVLAKPFLYRFFIQTYLYGGLRKKNNRS
jgi:apoptosis-inducing factor 2